MKTIEELEKLAKDYVDTIIDEASDEYFIGNYWGFIEGYKKAQQSLFSEEDMIDLIQSLKDYTRESHNILGFDDREAKDFLEIWKSERNK